jgi:hypothetical protein
MKYGQMKYSEIENIWNAEVGLLSNADRGRLFAAVTRARRQAVLIGTPGQFERVFAAPPRLDRRVALEVQIEQHPKKKSGRTDG